MVALTASIIAIVAGVVNTVKFAKICFRETENLERLQVTLYFQDLPCNIRFT